MLLAQSITKDYIKAEHKLHSNSKIFISQVSIPEVWFLSLFIFHGNSTREPASGRVTYLILRAYTGTTCLATANTEESGEVLDKMQVNGFMAQRLNTYDMKYHRFL